MFSNTTVAIVIQRYSSLAFTNTEQPETLVTCIWINWKILPIWRLMLAGSLEVTGVFNFVRYKMVGYSHCVSCTNTSDATGIMEYDDHIHSL
jgi:hypothetical protein